MAKRHTLIMHYTSTTTCTIYFIPYHCNIGLQHPPSLQKLDKPYSQCTTHLHYFLSLQIVQTILTLQLRHKTIKRTRIYNEIMHSTGVMQTTTYNTTYNTTYTGTRYDLNIRTNKITFATFTLMQLQYKCKFQNKKKRVFYIISDATH